MADAAVTFLLENLTQLLKSYDNLISGAQNELELLKEDLQLLKAYLEKAEDMANKDQTFAVLERQIREVSYDAEDAIDTCLMTLRSGLAAPKPKRFGLLRGSRNVSLAKEVKSVREDKVKPILEKAARFFATMGEGSSRRVEESWTAVRKVQLIREDNIVGFEDQEKIIIDYLNEETEKLDVITITGMPGLGKTSLAWKVYNSHMIQYEFPVRIWVYVSQDFSARDVFLNILKGFTKQDTSGLSDQDLIQTVRAYLFNGKFLLVMDDVWTREAWDAIQYVLPKNNKMGKVLITSRDLKVGKHANGTKEPHMLRFLNIQESWELLQLEVFGKLGDCPQELQEIGKVIAKQCNGLPLSLVVIGGILVEQYSPTRPIDAIYRAWEKVSENVSEHGSRDMHSRIIDIVALNYKNLSRNLRDCFLYLGVFPKDYEIPVRTLTRLWIAEGFVQHKEGRGLEEVAEENLNDLINMNLVMVGKTSPTGEVKTCRVHGVIHEFCKSKASVRDQNLFLQINKSDGVFQPSASDIKRCRRLCIHSHVNDFLEELQIERLKAPLVRSFLCFCKDPYVYANPKHLSTIPEAFKLLRVLDSKAMKINQFPPRITRLIHLRYITLSVDNLSILPEAVSELWNLQTLVVDTQSRVLEVKADIWKMIQLRHLMTKAEIILAIRGEGRGSENLQTLSRLSPKNCTQDVLQRAHSLKRLGIRGVLTILLENGTSFQNLDSLETLKLKHDLPYQSSSENPLSSLPPPNCFPPNIKRLTVSATFLDWEHMSTLAMIRTLEVLKLKDNAFMGMSWNVVGAGFPRLQFLLIENSDLVFWEASNDHFPSLWCLMIKNCEKLSTIPVGLARSLQMLKIERVPRSAVDSAKKIKEEKERMQARKGGFKLEIGPGYDL